MEQGIRLHSLCGSGSSGSVVAGRLAANPEVRALLPEAGGSDETEMVLGGELDWGFLAEPNPNLNGRSILYSMGRVLGGGSSINVGTWSKGHKADWDMYSARPRTRAGDMAPCVIVGERAAELLQQKRGS